MLVEGWTDGSWQFSRNAVSSPLLFSRWFSYLDTLSPQAITGKASKRIKFCRYK
jgi:hypothetical protein